MLHAMESDHAVVSYCHAYENNILLTFLCKMELEILLIILQEAECCMWNMTFNCQDNQN